MEKDSVQKEIALNWVHIRFSFMFGSDYISVNREYGDGYHRLIEKYHKLDVQVIPESI